MNKIKCIGKNGVSRIFKYRLEPHPERKPKEWIFFVHTLEEKEKDFFEFHLTEIDDNTAKVTMMAHHSQDEFIAMGIPERMIEEGYKVLKKQIISSTNSRNHQKLPNEYTLPYAVKVWKRLVSKGKAYFNEEEQVFYYKP
jgi:hypothetical protein